MAVGATGRDPVVAELFRILPVSVSGCWRDGHCGFGGRHPGKDRVESLGALSAFPVPTAHQSTVISK